MSSLEAKSTDYVECTSALINKLEAELESHRMAKSAAEALIEQAVDALILHEKIDEKSRQKAAAMLRDPATALEVLIRTADPSITVHPAPIGRPEPRLGNGNRHGNGDLRKRSSHLTSAEQARAENEARWKAAWGSS